MIFTRSVAKLLGSLLLGAALYAGWNAYATSGSPITVISEQEADGVAISGTSIDLVINRTKHRLCPTSTGRFMWRWINYQGERIQQFVPVENPPVSPVPEPGTDKFMLSLAIPSMPADGWYYRVVSLDNCSWLPAIFAPTVRQSVDTPIPIVPVGTTIPTP